jgi:large subunit ribosomal protein L24
MAGLFVKKGDTVQVIAGKDRSLTGKVISVDPDRDRVLVEGVNRITKHTKVTQSSRGSQQGGIVHQEAAVHVSNVQVVCPSCGKPTRVGRRATEPGPDGKSRRTRYCKRCNGDI